MEKEKKREPEIEKAPLPNTPAGDAQYDAELGDDWSEKRPPIPGGFLDRFGVTEVEVDPDEVD